MAAGTPEVGNSEAKNDNAQVEQAIVAIEKQEEKVENAETPAEEQKEQDKLDKLIASFDAMTERLSKVEERLAEPTVPAPPAKDEAPAVAPNSEGGEVTPVDAPVERKKLRRLGAWGS